MGEFELIRRLFHPVAEASHRPGVLLGPGDDGAIQRLEPGQDLVFSIDTLVEGVHFPRDYDPGHLGWRALAVAASDLAAMGADPVCFTLALTLPRNQASWLEPFARGLQRAAEGFGLALAGGDITRGPLTLSLQVHGSVPAGQVMCRSGARPGDLVCVSGTLGDAAAALDWLDEADPGPAAQALLQRYHAPCPRLALGSLLRGRATAAIDISDGLLADLGQILASSGVGARIHASRLPLSAPLLRLHPQQAQAFALRGGDDYELCFTLPSELLAAISAGTGVPVTVLGEITAGAGLVLVDVDGTEASASTGGYDHFGANNE